MDPKRKGKLKGMDPMYDGKADIKQNEKAKKKGKKKYDDDSEDDEDNSSEEEEN
jgi:hypothetical protein